MTMSDQLAALIDTLLQLRDERYPDIPDSLIHEIVAAHAEDPESSSLLRRIQRALEESLQGGRLASD
jgi:hypothetical protein